MTNRRDAEDAERRELDGEMSLLTGAVIGAAIEVHRCLGPGFLESVYQEALGIELQLRGIPFVKQSPVAVKYKGKYVGRGRLDLLVKNTLVVELKAVENLLSIHEAQVLSYLKMTDRKLGLLINFKVPILKNGIRRIILS